MFSSVKWKVIGTLYQWNLLTSVTVIVLTCISTVLSNKAQCVPLEIGLCKKLNLYNSTLLPNVFDQGNQKDIEKSLSVYKDALNLGCSTEFLPFLCSLFSPPCYNGKGQLPCREWCFQIQEQCTGVMEDIGFQWEQSLKCSILPTSSEQSCLNFTDLKNTDHSKRSSEDQHSPMKSFFLRTPPGTVMEYDFASDENTQRLNSFPQRRYDVIDLGDSRFFQGWADIQGIGAANDYCRVIGRKRRRFLSCVMAGSSGQDHHYVSKMAFDIGHANTWFMRDLDGDGRDDYCRCVGEPPETRISCMKSGEKGFYGGPFQPGNEYTFDIPASENCHNKLLNPHHGV